MEEEQQEYIPSGRDQHMWRSRFFTRLQRYKTLIFSKWWAALHWISSILITMRA